MLFRALMIGAMLVTTVVAAEKSPLADAPSAFVRAQTASAVHWQPWTDAVLAQAKQQTKSVYVFIGSPLSELTRATINQTFVSEKTVTWLNENFFCIFVDADAQPEVAAYAQHFIVTVKQLKGSPVHLWLAPDTLQPYDGSNYLPPSEEWGKPGYLKAARAALDTWKGEPARAHALATEAISMMKLPALPKTEIMPNAIKARLDKAAAAWIATIDSKNGGFGSAPKLPEPELIRFLLGRDQAAQAAALNAARALVAGALRDPVDGGFYRRCIDEEWKEPYFQKTLADQARIALALFDAADVAKDDKLRAAGIAALDFVLKGLKNPDGTFAAALDGTLEENVDPAERPKFVKVGSANVAALGQLASAMRRSDDSQFGKVTLELVGELYNSPRFRISQEGPEAHEAGLPTLATAADHYSLRLAIQGLRIRQVTRPPDDVPEMYFDPATGSVQASRNLLPPGIGLRVPASGENPSAEVLALLAGVDQKTADLIRRNLLAGIEYDDLPPGDVLLGLSQK